MRPTEIYISTDVETDGPIPGPNSMLSFASAAFTADKRLVSTYCANLQTIPGAVGDPKTMEWWSTQKEAWDAHRSSPRDPAVVMPEYVRWVKGLEREHRVKPVFVGYPAGFDFMFVYWYLIRFAGESPFSFSALDVKTFAMAVMRSDYRRSAKRDMPRSWFDGKAKHTHRALDDAVEQGLLFCNMLAQNRLNLTGEEK